MSKHNRSRSHEQRSADGQVQSGAPQGNRPANNARIATPGAISAPGWQGSAGADDFLGLNEDLSGEPAAAMPQPAPATTTSSTATVAPPVGDSWLFHAQDPEPEEVHVGDSQEEPPPPLPQEATFREEDPPARRLRPMLVKCAAALVIGMFGFAAFKVVVASRGGKPVDVKPLEPDKLSVTGGVEVSKPEPIETRAPGRKSGGKKAGQTSPNAAPSQSAPTEVATVRRSVDPETGATTPQAQPPEPVSQPSSSVAFSASAPPLESEPAPAQPAAKPIESAPANPEPIASASKPVENVVVAPVRPTPVRTTIVRPNVGEPLPQAIPDSVPAVAAATPAPNAEPIRSVPAASTEPAPTAPSAVQSGAPATEPVAASGDPASASGAAGGAASWNGWTAMRSPLDPAVRAQSRWSHENPGQDLASFSAVLGAQQSEHAAEPADAGKPATPVAAAKSELPAPPVDPVAEQKAKVKELKGVWSDTEIPVDSISASTKILTPNVGRVRAIIEGNEVFEGSLYAVGENTVWITSEYGRLGLSAARIVKLERLSSPTGTPVLGEKDSQKLTGLDKVRIKTPGGIFVGKIVAREGDQTIIVTEDGVRITLPTKDVELVGENPRLVIKPKSGESKPDGQKQP